MLHFLELFFCSWHWFYIVEKSYAKNKKIKAKILTIKFKKTNFLIKKYLILIISNNKLALKDVAFIAAQCYASIILKLFFEGISIHNFELQDD